MENDMYHIDINSNKDEVAILIFDKTDFWPNTRKISLHNEEKVN